VPASASARLGELIGSRDYTSCAIATGHIGMYVSRAAGAEIPGRIISWLAQRS
jgi:poly(3-hydroxyalkanoate) synthetase